MIKTEVKMCQTEIVSEVICNVCGKKMEKDKHGYIEDFIHVEKQWGYTSDNDGETETADICESCWNKFKETFKIK